LAGFDRGIRASARAFRERRRDAGTVRLNGYAPDRASIVVLNFQPHRRDTMSGFVNIAGWPVSRRSLLTRASAAAAVSRAPRAAFAQNSGPERLAPFREAKFGMFIHWGAYSVAGVEASWSLMRSMLDRSVSQPENPHGPTHSPTARTGVRRGDLTHEAKDQSFRYRKALGYQTKAAFPTGPNQQVRSDRQGAAETRGSAQRDATLGSTSRVATAEPTTSQSENRVAKR
jgi:hypothetical protein